MAALPREAPSAILARAGRALAVVAGLWITGSAIDAAVFGRPWIAADIADLVFAFVLIGSVYWIDYSFGRSRRVVTHASRESPGLVGRQGLEP